MKMKAQQDFSALIAAIGVAGISILIGFWIYGSVADIVPHDRSIVNESICTTCVNGSNGATTYLLTNVPVVNDTTFVCRNDTGGALMTRGVDNGVCLGYNVIDERRVNITNTSNDSGCQISNMQCSYTFNEANDNENAYWNSATTNINSSFSLASITPIVIAAIAVILIVMFLRQN